MFRMPVTIGIRSVASMKGRASSTEGLVPSHSAP